MRLMSIGPEFATVIWLEGLFRGFNNRRQLAAYAGLAPSPWRSGQIDRERLWRRLRTSGSDHGSSGQEKTMTR
jgi:transposase